MIELAIALTGVVNSSINVGVEGIYSPCPKILEKMTDKITPITIPRQLALIIFLNIFILDP
ncbi:hypothetical protein CANFE03_02250 [Ligilactobacillus animalis]